MNEIIFEMKSIWGGGNVQSFAIDNNNIWAASWFFFFFLIDEDNEPLPVHPVDIAVQQQVTHHSLLHNQQKMWRNQQMFANQCARLIVQNNYKPLQSDNIVFVKCFHSSFSLPSIKSEDASIHIHWQNVVKITCETYGYFIRQTHLRKSLCRLGAVEHKQTQWHIAFWSTLSWLVHIQLHFFFCVKDKRKTIWN